MFFPINKNYQDRLSLQTPNQIITENDGQYEPMDQTNITPIFSPSQIPQNERSTCEKKLPAHLKDYEVDFERSTIHLISPLPGHSSQVSPMI